MPVLAERAATTITVEVVASPAEGAIVVVQLVLAPGSTARQALELSGLLTKHPALEPLPAGVGIWGKTVQLDQVLVDGDRVEIYRAIEVDPKDARRRRANATRTRLKRPR